jgi:hypothetical protein
MEGVGCPAAVATLALDFIISPSKAAAVAKVLQED